MLFNIRTALHNHSSFGSLLKKKKIDGQMTMNNPF